MADARLEGSIGLCPGCDMPGPVSRSCETTSCVERGLRYIPAGHAAVLARERVSDALIGRRFEDTLVVGRLGIGGFGKVYLALSLSDGKPLALKLANCQGTPDEALARERLTAEARALGRLSHPNVVRFERAATWKESADDGPPIPFVLMEYVAGGTNLADAISDLEQRGQRFPPEHVGAILRQLLDALAAVHNHGIVHRDVKPANILVEPGEPPRVKLFDFGLAKFIGSRQAPSIIVGTPSHMAPEQLDGRGIGPWTDLYAVGVVACEMLTGRDPFDGETTGSVISRRRDASFDPLATLAAEDAITPAWRQLLTRALAPDPDDRFESAEDMRAALDEVLAAAAAAPAPVTVASPPVAREAASPIERDDRILRIQRDELDAPPPAPARRPMVLVWAVAGVLLGTAVAVAASGGVGDVAHEPLAAGTPAGPSVNARVLPPRAPPVESPPPMVAEPPAPTKKAAEPAAAAPEERGALLERIGRCDATQEELASLSAICAAGAGCVAVEAGGDLRRWIELGQPRSIRAIVLELAAPTFDEDSRCGAVWRRGTALADGAWDSLPASYGGYLRPRVGLELRFGSGRQRHVMHWLTGRATSADEMSTLQSSLAHQPAVCLGRPDLGGTTSPEAARAWEERSFYGAETGYTGESGRTPCRLDLERVYLITSDEM